MSILKIKNVSFQYDKNVIVLDNISIDIEEKSINAVLGKNGCGKSTLLNCIIGYLNEFNGEILLDSKNIKNYSSKEFARIVSYIPQSLEINMDYTVFDFVLFGRNCHLDFGKTFSQNDYDIVFKFLKELNIEHLSNKAVNKLSGGERQLVYIARSLAQEAKIIIMDEPTSALDYGNQQRFIRLIKRLYEEGKTIIFTTHNPKQCIDLDCNVIAIKDGSICCVGNANEVINKELIRSIYGDDTLEF